jgi:hypothetical protein
MFTQSTKNRVKYLVSAAFVLNLLSVWIVPLAFAGITIDTTIDTSAIVTDKGRHIIVTGFIGCDAGQRAFIRVTVTQRSTGTVAEAQTRITCTGAASQEWEVHVSTGGKERFQEGAATAVALARTTDRGNTDDAHQELVDIMLVSEGGFIR